MKQFKQTIEEAYNITRARELYPRGKVSKFQMKIMEYNLNVLLKLLNAGTCLHHAIKRTNRNQKER